MSSILKCKTVSLDNDTNSTLLLDNKDVICPICKEVFVLPRTYDCGHTVCELCMYEMDKRDCSKDTHTAKVHHCPVCRKPTLKSWQYRPVSVILEKICSKHPQYEERKKEVMETKDAREGCFTNIPVNINLAEVSHTQRIKLALSLYAILIERLYKAAQRGLSHLIINEPELVKDIEKVIDILSIQLFHKHNICKMLVTRGECTIYIHKDAFKVSRTYLNTDWIDPTDIEDDSIDEEGGGEGGGEGGSTSRFTETLQSLLSNSNRPLLPPTPPGLFSRHV